MNPIKGIERANIPTTAPIFGTAWNPIKGFKKNGCIYTNFVTPTFNSLYGIHYLVFTANQDPTISESHKGN